MINREAKTMQAVLERPETISVQDYFEDLKQGRNNLISCEQLEKELDKDPTGLYLLDIRKPEDFEKGHIEGAINIPWAEVGEYLEDIPKDQRIVVICYSGQTAGQLTGIMRLLGFRVCSLKGGMSCDQTYLPIQAGCAS